MAMLSKAERDEARRLNAECLKRCPQCGTVKPLSDFHRHSSTWDGLASHCRDCKAARHREGATRHRDKWASPDADPYADPSPKRCSTCKHSRPRTDFPTAPCKPDGLGQSCRECDSARTAVARERSRQTWTSIDADPYADSSLKKCSACTQHRPRTDFTTNPSCYDGLHPECKGCNASRNSSRRAQILGQWVEHVDRNTAWELAGGICHLCGHPVPKDCFDLDHVDPIVNGGEHSYFNTAPTHPECNRSKGGKPWPDVSWPEGDEILARLSA